MTQALDTSGHPAAVVAQPHMSPDQVELLKRTICKGATDDELQLFMYTCSRSGLDPFARQIHAVKRWDSKEKRETMAIQVGIDGFRLIADRTGTYADNDDAIFEEGDGSHPLKASVTVYKLVQGERCAFSKSARWDEYVQTRKDGQPNAMWTQRPYGQLGKCAESLALRTAFPAELSGLYTTEEMGQADNSAAPPPPANGQTDDMTTEERIRFGESMAKWEKTLGPEAFEEVLKVDCELKPADLPKIRGRTPAVEIHNALKAADQERQETAEPPPEEDIQEALDLAGAPNDNG